ncbi:MAG: hypothetical protein ACJARL_003561 [Halopseudomonas sp.]|jgi:hypothetical protein
MGIRGKIQRRNTILVLHHSAKDICVQVLDQGWLVIQAQVNLESLPSGVTA